MTETAATAIFGLVALLAPFHANIADVILPNFVHPSTADAVKSGADVASMDHADPAIQRALAMLGEPVGSIRVVNREQAREIYRRWNAGDPSPGLSAFRVRGGTIGATIHVNGDSAVYRDAAAKPTAIALLKLAATLVHEQVHHTDGDHAAYRLQSDFVRSRLNALPRNQQAEARRYIRSLDTRAAAHARVRRPLRG